MNGVLGTIRNRAASRDFCISKIRCAMPLSPRSISMSFEHHADRVRLANIAQMVNVLQAMILTKGPQMILTPTYHVFKMYQPFQDATYLPAELSTPQYTRGGASVPAISLSAARTAVGIDRRRTGQSGSEPVNCRFRCDIRRKSLASERQTADGRGNGCAQYIRKSGRRPPGRL